MVPLGSFLPCWGSALREPNSEGRVCPDSWGLLPRSLCCAPLPLRAGGTSCCSDVERCFVRGKGKAVNKRLAKGIGWLAALMMCCLMLVVAPTSAWAVEDVTLYVGGAGASDKNTGTSESSPLASLAAAFGKIYDKVGQNVTIYVIGDQIVDSTMRVWEDSVTLIGVGDAAPVLTRSKDFETTSDPARGTYNGAMIEVGGSTGNDIKASLTLKNIVLDDNGLHEGERFLQAASNGGEPTESTISSATVKVNGKDQTHFPAESTDDSFLVEKKKDDKGNTYYATKFSSDQIVQDAIIASYNGKGDITLGEGAVLRNYGGMSAVRITGSSKLTMLAGSAIEDTMNIERSRTYVELKCSTANCADDKHAFPVDLGPAGAVWMQGGVLDMHQGAIIGGAGEDTPMVGRAIYDEGGTATVNGAIKNVKASGEVWQGRSGTAIHVRGDGQAILGGTGVIDTITSDVHSGYTGAVMTNGDRNEGEGNVGEGYDFEAKEGSVIRNVTGFPTLFSNYGNELLNGTIENCTNDYIVGGFAQVTTIGETGVIQNCDATKGAAKSVVYTSNASDVYMYGTVKNNKVSTAAFYIINQSGGGAELFIYDGAVIEGTGSGYGVYVNASESKAEMNGGLISGFTYGVDSRGKSGRDATFIMNDGAITGNSSYGVYANGVSNSQSICELNGGVIEGNGSAEVCISGGYAEDAYEHVKIAAGVVRGNHIVSTSPGDVTLDEDYADIQLGQAKSDAVKKIKDLVAAKDAGWSVAGIAGLWIKPSGSDAHFLFERPYSAKNTTMYVAYIPVGTDGLPASDAKLTLVEVGNADPVDITLSGLTPNQSYAMMLVNTDIYRLAPDDVTKYIGGGQGEEGNYDETRGFPEVTFANCLDEITSMTIGNKDVEGDHLQALFNLLEVTYTDTDGNTVTSDREPGEYIVHLAWKNSPAPAVRINDNDVDTALGTGKLIVRHIENTDEAQNGTNTHALLTEEPTSSVEHAEAIAKESFFPSILPTKFYTNDDESREVDAEGIQLLDDDLLTYKDEDRTTPMENKGNEYLGSAGEGKEWSYEFHYLDLVDAYNGNAWVSASYGTTVYLPYPEGVTAANAAKLGVKVIHYKDLHREYGITGQTNVEVAIKACEMETMETDFTEQGIKFDTERAGFSPFAIAWKTDAPDEPDTPVTPPSKHYTITASAGEGGSISPFGSVSVAAGADKTFIFMSDEGYRVADVIVDGESLGALGSYTFEDVARDHTIQVVFKPGNAPADPDDTGVSDWLNTKDHDVYLHGYQDGSNTFKPNGNMTRGEVACMFYNLLLDKSMGDTPVAFEDVPDGAFYAEPIRVLASRGILFGTSPTTFDPDRPITRAEFTAIAMRFSKGDLSGENIFVDVAEGTWYHDVIVGSIKYGWIYGYQDGSHRFGPDDTITRAEATCIANRMLGRLPDGAYIAEHKDELKLFSDVSEEHFAWRDIVEATNAHNYVKDGGYEDWTSLKDGADA